MPISTIDEIIYTKEKDRHYFKIDANIKDKDGNKMLIYKLDVSKKKPKTLEVELGKMDDLVKSILAHNKNIKVQSVPLFKKIDHNKADMYNNNKPIVAEKGNFYYDKNSEMFMENGKTVDEFGRPIKSSQK